MRGYQTYGPDAGEPTPTRSPSPKLDPPERPEDADALDLDEEFPLLKHIKATTNGEGGVPFSDFMSQVAERARNDADVSLDVPVDADNPEFQATVTTLARVTRTPFPEHGPFGDTGYVFLGTRHPDDPPSEANRELVSRLKRKARGDA